jgi:integrase
VLVGARSRSGLRNYAHARFNYSNPELQNQMGHACATTTEHYRRWAERQMSEYGAYLPARLESGKEAGEQRE